MNESIGSSETGSVATATNMSPEQVDRTLRDLGEVVDTLIRETAEAEQHVDELDDHNEAALERENYLEFRRSPEHAFDNARFDFAVASAKLHREKARQFASWWVDASLVALRATASSVPVSAARLAAANPQIAMRDEELRELPAIDEHTRQLVELASFLGPDPEDPVSSGGLAQEAARLATRSGLILYRDDEGNPRVKEDDFPEGRRCRLWGDSWTELQIPRLLRPEELDVLLTHASDEAAADVRETARSVAEALTMALRLKELTSFPGELSPAQESEYERLLFQDDDTTQRLAAHARAVTRAIQEIRPATHPNP